MAGFLRSPSVSLQSGSKEIQVTGGVNCSFVVSGTAVYLNDMILLEGVSGTNTDLSGNSTITLRDTYLGDTITGATLTAFNTIEGLRDAIQRARSLAARLDESTTFFGQIITATTPTIEVDINGVPTEVTPYGYLSQQVTELIALADGAADTLIELQGDVALLSATVDSIQSELDAKVLSAQNSANAAAASETVVITAESVVTTARDTVLLARDETVSAKDTTLTARDTVLAAEAVVTTAEGVVVAAEASTLAARDSALLSESNTSASETASAGSALLAQEWAVSSNIIGVDQRSSKYWAEYAKENADLTSVSGGVFTPTVGQEYPVVENPTRDTTFLISFDDPSGSYTFTTGNLIGATVFSTYILFWDEGLGEFQLVTSPSGAAVLVVNNKTGSTIELRSEDIPHESTNVNTALAGKLEVTEKATKQEAEDGISDSKWMTPLKVKDAIGFLVKKASTAVEGIVALSNSFTGVREDVATTEKALKDGLDTKLSLTGNSTVEGSVIVNDLFAKRLVGLRGDTEGGELVLQSTSGFETSSGDYLFDVAGLNPRFFCIGTGTPTWRIFNAGSGKLNMELQGDFRGIGLGTFDSMTVGGGDVSRDVDYKNSSGSSEIINRISNRTIRRGIGVANFTLNMASFLIGDEVIFPCSVNSVITVTTNTGDITDPEGVIDTSVSFSGIGQITIRKMSNTRWSVDSVST